MYPKLTLGAAALAFIVVVVGAYVRLQSAGLGCPDWPGCYGQLIGVPVNADDLARAAEAFPGAPVEANKAWTEMFHRYLAGTLGIFILAIAVTAWRTRRMLAQSPLLASTLVGVVALQAALGMWTVTLLLKPVIVTLHLLGGMTTLALLTWLALRQRKWSPATERAAALRPWATVGLIAVLCQIALGGWVSTNYAAVACLDFPTCHGLWVPDMDFHRGFQLVRELGVSADGAPLLMNALNAINWTHRLGALIVFLVLGPLAIALMRASGYLGYGAVLAFLLVLQISIGVANVLMRFPLLLAAAHNAGAAALLVMLLVINFALSRRSQFPR